MPYSKTKRSAQGAGTIRKKTVKKSNGKTYTYWEARYSMGYDPVTGKQIQHTLNGKTQKEVADLIGISQSYISRLEKKIIRRLRDDLEAVIFS